MPYTAKDSLLSGADLLRTMEAQPEASQAMWEGDSSNEDSDSDTENHFSNGASEANAAPCMTIGAGTYGSGASLLPSLLNTGSQLAYYPAHLHLDYWSWHDSLYPLSPRSYSSLGSAI